MRLLVTGGAGFIGSTFVRRRLALTDDSIVSACTSVQQGFFDWVKTLDPSDPHPFKDPLVHVRDIALGTESIRFVLINSAWCSTLTGR